MLQLFLYNSIGQRSLGTTIGKTSLLRYIHTICITIKWFMIHSVLCSTCRYAAVMWRPGEWTICSHHYCCICWPGKTWNIMGSPLFYVHAISSFWLNHSPNTCSGQRWKNDILSIPGNTWESQRKLQGLVNSDSNYWWYWINRCVWSASSFGFKAPLILLAGLWWVSILSAHCFGFRPTNDAFDPIKLVCFL